MFLNKKAVHPVVAVSLLLVVSVIAVVGFQGWFQTFSTSTILQVEQTSQNSPSDLKVEGLINNQLYLNTNSDNSNLNSIKILDSNDNQVCDINTKLDNQTQSNLDSYLVGDWDFSNQDFIIEDLSGNGNTGTFYGSTRFLANFDNNNSDLTSYNHSIISDNSTVISSDCVKNSCLSFDATTSIKYNSENKFNYGTNEYSISLWFKSNISKDEWQFLFHNEVHQQKGQYLGIVRNGLPNGDKLHWQISESGTYEYIDSNVVVNDDAWHHVVITRNRNNNISMYLDGVYQNSINTSKSVNSDLNLTLGNNLQGSIDEVSVYSYELSNSQIQDLYTSNSAKFFELKSPGIEFKGVNNLVGYVDFGTLTGISDLDNFSIYSKVDFYGDNNYPNHFSIWSFYQDINNRFYLHCHNDLDSGWKIFGRYLGTGFGVSDAANPCYAGKYTNIVNVNSKNFSIYENGYHTTDFNHTTLLNYPFRVGNMGTAGSAFHGIIENVKVFNKILSQNERELLYAKNLKNINKGLSKVDLFSCNTTKGQKYTILMDINNNLIEHQIISK